MDGGRVFRSIIWQATGSLRRATEIAAAAGTLVAYAFFVWGFIRVVNNELLAGIWIAAIGWFLQDAASASVQQVRVESTLRGTTVADILRPDPTTVQPGTTVSDLIEQHLLPDNRRAMPVVDGRLIGIVTLSDIRKLPPAERATTPVAAVMGGRDGVVTVTPQSTLADALEALGRGDFEQVPVVDDGRVLGLITRADVVRQFQLRAELGLDAAGRK